MCLLSSPDSWLLISVSSVDTHSMRSARRAFSCRSPMASIPRRPCASRWPISRPTKCDVLSGLFGGRHAVFYNITLRQSAHPEDFKADMVTLFDLLCDRAIHPVVIDRLPLSAAREVHTRIDAGGLGGKIVLLPWPEA